MKTTKQWWFWWNELPVEDQKRLAAKYPDDKDLKYRAFGKYNLIDFGNFDKLN